jgi:RNA polymerase sigma-70 factor (ECF subfamily)
MIRSEAPVMPGSIRTAVAAFLGELDPITRARLEPSAPQIEAALGRHSAAGRATWPDVANIDDVAFAAEVGRRLGADADLDVVDKLPGSDLYLAIACGTGVPAALRCFEREFLEEVDRAGRKMKATPEQTADVRAHVLRILFVSEPGRPAATLAFSGRGDLRGYIKIIATRELVRVVNRERRELPHDLLEALTPASDPELSLLRARYRGDVDLAIRAAILELDARARTLLRYNLIDSWSIDQIGRLYGVHRATAARWLTAARDALAVEIRRALATKLAIEIDEVDSIVRLVSSRIDLSLARLLTDEPVEGET